MLQLTNQQLEAILDFPSLVRCLQQAFQEEYAVPLRHHHDFANPVTHENSTLLLMPAWQVGGYLGVKLVTVSPGNSHFKLPSINGIYILFDAVKGIPLVQLDAKLLTNLRTAAASALASQYLSRADSRHLLVLGTGSLAPFLIRAHASVRPIEHVTIWGRSPEKAQHLTSLFAERPKNSYTVTATTYLAAAVAQADIISCATMSVEPILKGEWLQAGQHIDLVGSYKPTMREADDEVIRRSRVFVDTFEGAIKESGDIVLPLKHGVMVETDIQADLFSLCRGRVEGRQTKDEITCFKSVGLALEDLAAAKMAYLAYQSNEL
ncbi:MAG: ornithine cyclodeaminase family protein [Bacteroidota bacterium]